MSIRLLKRDYEQELKKVNRHTTEGLLTYKVADVVGAPYHFRQTCDEGMIKAHASPSDKDGIYILPVSIADAHDPLYVLIYNLEIDPADFEVTSHGFFFKIQDPSVQFISANEQKEFDLNVGRRTDEGTPVKVMIEMIG